MSPFSGWPGFQAYIKAALDAIGPNVTSLVASMATVLAKLPTSGRAVSDAVLDNTKVGHLDLLPGISGSPVLKHPIAGGLPLPGDSFLQTGLAYSSQGVAGYSVAYASAPQTTAFQTILSVTGSGVLQLLSFGANNSVPSLRVTIDGAVVLDVSVSLINADFCIVGGYVYDSSVGKVTSIAFDNIPFHSQLLIQAKAATASGTVHVRHKYRRTS